MDKNSGANGGMTISFGIPSVVVGVLIALKKVGMTSMSYTDILWFGLEVFLYCALFGLLVWFIIMLVVLFLTGLSGYK